MSPKSLPGPHDGTQAHNLPRGIPRWVPEGTARYLVHTQQGISIRELARVSGVHASTVSRQVRRVEGRRDDPLVDEALETLGRALSRQGGSEVERNAMNERDVMSNAAEKLEAELQAQEVLNKQARRVLRRLCETGTRLAVAENMDNAVVVSASGDRIAVVPAEVAQAFALKDWIHCDKPGRISRYAITAAGRAALSRLVAETENARAAARSSGFAEAQTPFAAQHREWGERVVTPPEGSKPKRQRFNVAESPLTLLARRKDRDGNPFLNEDLVRAGERLREDFELAQMGPRVAQNWDRFLTGGARGGFSGEGGIGCGPAGARERVAQAMADLGPGLSDVALRCCCFLEGLEVAEKRMGWSARSGKIVLRIALQRLAQHYAAPRTARQVVG